MATPRYCSHCSAEIGWFAPDDLPTALAFPGHIVEVLKAWRVEVERGSPGTPRPDPRTEAHAAPTA